MTAAEYSESVRQWLVQAYQWQAITHCKLPVFAYINKNLKLLSFCHASTLVQFVHIDKGQRISKANYGFLNSSKKPNETHYPV